MISWVITFSILCLIEWVLEWFRINGSKYAMWSAETAELNATYAQHLTCEWLQDGYKKTEQRRPPKVLEIKFVTVSLILKWRELPIYMMCVVVVSVYCRQVILDSELPYSAQHVGLVYVCKHFWLHGLRRTYPWKVSTISLQWNSGDRTVMETLKQLFQEEIQHISCYSWPPWHMVMYRISTMDHNVPQDKFEGTQEEKDSKNHASATQSYAFGKREKSMAYKYCEIIKTLQDFPNIVMSPMEWRLWAN